MPSVTKITGLLDKPALIGWAVNRTLDYCKETIFAGKEYTEEYLIRVFEEAKKQQYRLKKEAADIGTQAHDWLQEHNYLSSIGETLDWPEHPKVRNCVEAGLEWIEKHHVKFLHTERRIYSKEFGYSGTADGIAYVDDVLSLPDYKSGKSVYPEFRLQTAAYVHAYEEEFPDVRIENRYLIRLGKEDGEYDPHLYPREKLELDFRGFLGLLQAHNSLEVVKKELKTEAEKDWLEEIG